MTLDTQRDEPQFDLPPTAAGSEGHDAIVADALREGEIDARLGELDTEGDYTADQLREALGDVAEGLSDEELVAEWKKAQAAEVAGAQDGKTAEGDEDGEIVPVAEPIKLEGFKLYDAEGKEIADPSKVSITDLLTGKVQIGYNAFKGEQRKALRDLTRVASLGHYNEKQMVDLRSERAQAMQRATAAEARVAQFTETQQLWDQALVALIGGNAEPIQRLALLYQQKLLGGGAAPTATPTSNDAALEQAGQDFVLDTVVPYAADLAAQYGAKANEVTRLALYLMQQEGEFLTEEKIADILQVELPAALETAGFSPNGATAPKPPADPRDAQIADLTKRLAAIEAGKANDKTANLRNKNRKVPPAGGGSTPSGGEAVPELKSRDDMKRYLRGE